MKRYLITITGRANLGYKGNRLRERDLCCAYVYGMNKAEAISKFWEQIEKSSGLKCFERRDFKLTAERWEKEADLDVHGNPLKDLEWAIPFDLLSSVEMEWDNHSQNYKLAVPKSIMAMAEASEDADQAKAERIHDQILETAQEGNSEAQDASSDDQLASLKAKREQLAKKQHHILERYGNNEESQSIFKEITEIDSQIKKIEFKNGAVVRIVDLDSSFYGEWGIIKKFDGSFYYLAMHGDEHGLLLIMKEEQIEILSLESRMKTLTDFRAQAQEALDQAEEIMLKLRNMIDVFDDQIAKLFIKGAEMRTGKEAE